MTSMRALQLMPRTARVGLITPEAIARGEIYDYLERKGIRPFDDASVERYKQAKKRRSEIIAKVTYQINKITWTNWWLMGASVAGALAGGLLSYLGDGLTWGMAFWVIGWSVFALFLAGATSLTICLVWEVNHGAHWETVTFQQHNDDGRKIPRRVRELARTIRDERPDCMVLVERFAGDPFLTVCPRIMKHVAVRVAVWGEWGSRIPKA